MAVETLRPNGTGQETGIADEYPSGLDHYTLVDEAVADEDATMVISYEEEEYDIYALPNHSEGSGTINKVTVYIRTNNDDTLSGGYCKTVIRTHDTDYYGAEEDSDGEWTTFNTEYATNPNTGLAWTWDEIDALQAGVLLGQEENYATQVYVEVDYTPPSGIQIFRRRIEGY